MNRSTSLFRLALPMIGIAILAAGCSDYSKSPSDNDNEIAPAPLTTVTTVTPSLGLIRLATVSLISASGNPIDGASGELGANGSVDLTYAANTQGPIIVNVAGDEDAEYYDESADAFVPFPTGSNLRAVIPQPQAEVGVTALTEVAVTRFEATSGSTAADASAVNEEVRQAFLPGVSDITAAPTLVSSTNDKVKNDEAGLYAAYLGALAGLGSGQDAPALAVTQQLATDFSDGNFDTAVSGVNISTPVFNNQDSGFTAQFNASLSSTVSRFGDTSLSTDNFTNVVGNLSPSTGGGNGNDGMGGGNMGSQVCVNGATPVVATLPASISGKTINFKGSFIAAGASPGFAIDEAIVFVFGTDGSLTQGGNAISNLPYTCGGTEISWYNVSADKLLSLSFKADDSINEMNFNKGDGTFLGQAVPDTTTPDNSNPDTGNPDTGNPTNPDNGGAGGISDLFGAGFDPVFPATIPALITPVAPIDVRPEVPGLFASWVIKLGARVRGSSLENTTGFVSELNRNTNSYVFTVMNTDGVPVRQVRYQLGPDGKELTNDDIIVGYDIYDVNVENKRTGVDGIYTAVHPGKDGIWFTDDDRFSEGKELSVEVVLDGNRILAVGNADTQQRLLPGNDGVLFTADDQLGKNRGFIVIVLDANGNRGQVVVFSGTTFTGDEEILSYALANFDNNVDAVQTVTYSGKGADNSWFTNDDNVGVIVVGILSAAKDQLDYLLTYAQAGTDNVFFTSDDVLTSITAYQYDTNGRVTFQATHSGTGADGVFFTADDTASTALAFKYDANGKVNYFVTSNGIGADTIWFTGDDDISAFQVKDTNAAGLVTLSAGFVGAGVDGIWFTADDLSNFASRITYNAAGEITQRINYGPGVGNDGLSLTADDVSFYQLFVFDAAGKQIISLFAQPGEDGIAFTADDTGGVNVPTFNAAGQVIKNKFENGPGADAIWFNADDVVTSLTLRTIVDGEFVRSDTFNDAGPDGIFETADDVQSSARSVIKTLSESTAIDYSGPGEDGIWGNSDDLISGYQVSMLDSNGRETMLVFYSDAGADGVFITNDDVPNGYTILEYDSAGNVTLNYTVFTPGADGIYFTNDDKTSPYERLSYNADGSLKSRFRFQDPGPDGIYLTADDVLTGAEFGVLDSTFIATTAGNAGFTGASCPVDQSNTGSVTLLVRNAFGTPISGVTVQLDAAGLTQATDVDGKAVFAGLSGSHDFHVFSNTHSWESFLCFSPSGDVTINATLNEKIDNGSNVRKDTIENSAVFISGRDFSTLYVLMDSAGKILGTNVFPIELGPYRDGSTSEWSNIPLYSQRLDGKITLLDLPAGSQVTAELWAYRYELGSLKNGLVEAVKVADSTTYTTLALNTIGQAAIDAAVDVTATFTTATLDTLDTLYTSTNSNIFRLSNGIGSKTTFLDSKRKLQQPLGIGSDVKFVDSIDHSFGSARLAVTAIPTTGLIDSFLPRNSKFVGEPIVSRQSSDGLPNPAYTWVPATQNIEGNWFAVQNLILDDFTKNIEWVIHLPAGVGEVNFPAVPNGIDSTLFSEAAFSVNLRVFSSGGLGYVDAIVEGELFEVPIGVDYDEVRSSTVSYSR